MPLEQDFVVTTLGEKIRVSCKHFLVGGAGAVGEALS